MTGTHYKTFAQICAQIFHLELLQKVCASLLI